MAFQPDQIAALQAPLSSAVVKSRQQGGSSVSYVEAYHCENEANRIFGFGAWDRFTEIALVGEAVVDSKHRVYYRAKVRIVVRQPDGEIVTREGCGYGSGIDRDLGQAHESALKEAESDAEKRALKTFGNPFGQALYDKAKSEVAAPERPKPVAKPDVFSGAVLAARAGIDLCKDEPALNQWGSDNKAMIQSMDPPDAALVREHYGKRLMVLRGELQAAA